MRARRRARCPLATLLAFSAFSAIALRAAPAGSGVRDAVVIIRCGAVPRDELSPGAKSAPHQRWLLANGATVARVRAGYPPDGVEFVPKYYANLVLPPDVRKHLRDQGIAVTVVDPRAPAIEGDAEGEGDADDSDRAPPPPAVVARLHELFGAPEPASDAETSSMAAFRQLLGLTAPATASDGSVGAESPAPSGAENRLPPSDFQRAARALEKGARLVLILDPIREGVDAATRDKQLGTMLDFVVNRRTTSVATLLVPADDPNRALLRVFGPGVRSGWVSTRLVTFDEVTPTLLWLAGSKRFDGNGNLKDVIDEILE